MSRTRNGQAPPARRVVLLGASNLTRAIPTVVETARLLWNEPLEFLSALGAGRSYGINSTLMGRTLPGISVCGLWKALAERRDLPTAALVTDIGNDLLYEVAVPKIAGWVEACLDRLLAVDAKIVMTLLPTENIASLSEWRFRIVRRLLVPRNRSSLQTLAGQVVDLNERVRQLGRARRVTLVEHQTGWYGFDPIHIRRRHRSAAWRQILMTWSDRAELPAAVRISLMHQLYLRSLSPERHAFLGVERRRLQPAGRLQDGTTLAFY